MPEHRDLWDFAERVKAILGAPADLVTAAAALVAQLGTSILVSAHQDDHPGAHGLAIRLPGYQTRYDYEYDGAGAVWSQHSTWDEFLKTFTTP